MRSRLDETGYDRQAKQYQDSVVKAMTGEWGTGKVLFSGKEVKQVDQIRYKYMYEFMQKPPENFVAQMAFSKLNSFLLTTDGRVFSWGAITSCLGREINIATGEVSLDNQRSQAQLEDLVEEIQFPQINGE